VADQRSQLGEGVGLLKVVAVAVVNTLDTLALVAEDTLGAP